MKFTLGLLLASLAIPTFAHSHTNSLSSRSFHNKRDAYLTTARMHKQRRAARQEQRKAKRSAAVEQKKRSDSAALFAAKMVAKKAKRSTLGDGTTDVQPDNIAQGTATAAEGCTLWHTVIAGEVCLGVIDKSEGLTLEDFYGLNPDVGSDCGELRVGLAYCIDTDHQDDASVKNANTSTCTTSSTSSSSNNDDDDDDDDSSSTSSSAGSSSSSASRNGATAIVPIAGKTKTATSATPSATGSSSTDEAGFHTNGVINVSSSDYDASCGAPGAQTQSTETTGPNGSIDWLNCGISKSSPDSKWTPPKIAIHDIVVKELSGDGIFAPCTSYFDLFEKYGKQYDIPPIFLASFAMQESTCQPNARGDNGGAYGLMQITADKCTSGIACDDPDYNVRTAAKYFRDTLDSNNGDLLLSIGQYNGWVDGMSYNYATRAAYSDCCVCMNNLDYLHQMLNGWANNVSADTLRPYNNLAVCGGSQSGNSRRSIAGSHLMAKWNSS